MRGLVGRLPRAGVVDLEVELEPRRLTPADVDDELEPATRPRQCRDPLDHAPSRLAGERTVDEEHEIEVALTRPVAADEAGAEHERVEHLDLAGQGADDRGAVALRRLVEMTLRHGDHEAYATLPAATVIRTAPSSVRPSSHEFADRERKAPPSTRSLASRSSRTRFAGAPTAIRGASRP